MKCTLTLILFHCSAAAVDGQWSDPNSCLTTNLRPSPSLDSTTVLWLAVWLCSATTVSSIIEKFLNTEKKQNFLYPTSAIKAPTKIC